METILLFGKTKQFKSKGWLLDSFPIITDERQQQIQSYVVDNIDQLVQAKSDTYSYGIACALGNEYYCHLYAQALSTISSIKL